MSASQAGDLASTREVTARTCDDLLHEPDHGLLVVLVLLLDGPRRLLMAHRLLALPPHMEPNTPPPSDRSLSKS